MSIRRRFRSMLILLSMSAFFLLCPRESAHAETDDCIQDGPLVFNQWEDLDLVGPNQKLGEWKLPISPQLPDIVTEARVRLEAVKNPQGSGWKAWVFFSFPDPLPLGIPFTFQKVQISWEHRGRNHFAELDWSDDCSGPGRSLYPRQSWSASFDLGDEARGLLLGKPVFRLWGSRN